MAHALRLPHISVFPSLVGYQRSWLSGDVVAGLTVWAVLVPEALAYATVAGVSPIVGLYAAPGALLAYAAFGSSRHLVVGPMSATAALSAAVVADLVAPGDEAFLMLTMSLALTVGLLGIIAAVFRFGFVANFVSEPVMKGFIIGLALTIISGQLASLLGLEKGEGNFFEKTWAVVKDLGEINGWTAAVGFASLAIVMGVRRYLPRVPGSLVAVVFGILAIVVFNLDSEGVAIVGAIDGGLPDAGIPEGLSGSDLLDLAPGALGVLLVGFAEGLGAAKNYAARNGYQIDPDKELLGLGAANIASGLTGGMVVNGSLSKTAVNGGAGARTQLSGLIVAVMTVFTFLFLTGLFEELPEATLAAIVIGALIELVTFRRCGVCTESAAQPSVRCLAWRHGPTSWRRWRRCWGYCSSTRCQVLVLASSRRSSCCSTGRTGRESPTWAAFRARSSTAISAVRRRTRRSRGL